MDDEKLIDFVQKNNFLYDKRHINFKNKQKKQDAWSYIANELGCSQEMCIRRCTNLRDRFSKYRKDTQLASGSGATESESNWHLYDELKFLNAHVQPRKTRGTDTMSQSSKAPSPISPLSSTQSFFDRDNFAFSDIIEIDNISPSVTMSTPVSESLPTTPSPAPSSRNKKNGQGELHSSIISALSAWKTHFQERQQISGTITGFGTMLSGMIAELPKEKQARAMRNAMDAVIAEQD